MPADDRTSPASTNAASLDREATERSRRRRRAVRAAAAAGGMTSLAVALLGALPVPATGAAPAATLGTYSSPWTGHTPDATGQRRPDTVVNA